MGLFSKKAEPSDGGSPDQKPGWYARYQNSKKGEIRDEDLQKYLGKSKEEIMSWAENEPGVGKNRAAGTLAAGATSGLGGMAAADGRGGWGQSAGANDRSGGLKYPPKQPQKGDVTSDDERTLA